METLKSGADRADQADREDKARRPDPPDPEYEIETIPHHVDMARAEVL